MKRILFLAAISILSAGCNFYWNAPVTIKLKSGETIFCKSGIYTDTLLLYCKMGDRRGESVNIRWEIVKEFRTHS